MAGPGGRLRELMASEPPIIAPLCLEALVGRLIESTGFKAAYVGGGALGYSMAISEALFTITELATVTRQITQRVSIPVICDGTVGFGDAVHMVRSVWELEAAGAAGAEYADQVVPKRVHHHKGVDHVDKKEVFAEKIEEAARARRDKDFVIIARSAAARDEGFESFLDRMHAYVDAGADAILAGGNALEDSERIRKEFSVPIVLMGRQNRAEAAKAGASLVLDPFTTQVVAFKAIKDALAATIRGEAPADDIMSIYRELPGAMGIQELWDIEARTTEKALYEAAQR
jgi:2-methylisocitrate lyase-like PEP mutase family enzyme